MLVVLLTNSLRNEHLHRLADQFVVGITKEKFGLFVDLYDGSGFVYPDNCIRDCL